MQTNNLNTVKVLFTDSKYNYETNVSSNSTEQTAKEYNLPYHSYSTFVSALADHTRMLKNLGKKNPVLA